MNRKEKFRVESFFSLSNIHVDLFGPMDVDEFSLF